MTSEKLYEVFGEINETYVSEANGGRGAKTVAWQWWKIAAACLCLGIVVSIPYILYGKGGPSQDDLLRPLHVIEYNGAYYEKINMTNTKILDQYHLPHEITPDMVGQPLGSGWTEDGARTEEVFYQYAPYADISTVTNGEKRAQRAVYVMQDGEAYSFALFCNFIMFDSNTHVEAGEMLAVYGVDEAADIAMVSIDGKETTDPEQMAVFFEGLLHSYAMGNEDYQTAIFKRMGEEEQQALATQLADSMIEISMQTTEGLVIHRIKYFPTIQYVSWALNYYKLDSPLQTP